MELTGSMSRAGNPHDNAKCESLMKTLKQEEIHTRKYRDRADVEAHIGEFFNRYYNLRRLHSALGYRTPEQFEQRLLAQPAPVPAASMRFPRHRGICRPDADRQAGGRHRDAPRTHRCDEFQPGIPRRVALQQWVTRPMWSGQ
jgi:hypothetical protein